MIEFITGVTPALLYPFLFFGIIFMGGLVLIPAIYLTQVGAISLSALLIVVLTAGILADSVWYFIGRKGKKDAIYKLPYIRSKIKEAEQFSLFFSKHGVLLVYLTKFIYGTRIASHVLAGLHKINYLKFVIATVLGTATWFFIFYILMRFIDAGVEGTQASGFRIQVIFLVLISLLLTLNWFTGKYVRRWIMRSKAS